MDMIYCETIPNTTEALLVIVKSGSVYLDGNFPLDSIPEELIIFLTQQNNFEIYTYGDVPISEAPESGKFSFESSSVKSFTILDKPVFPTLPRYKMYQLQLVDPVLKAQGIGVFPTKQILTVIIILGLAWMIWSYLTMQREEVVKPVEVNKYQAFLTALNSPAPEKEVPALINLFRVLNTIPGWSLKEMKYANGSVTAAMISNGGTAQDLFAWGATNHISVAIKKDGMYLSTTLNLPKRPYPTKIYDLKKVMAAFIDKLAIVYPGNHLSMGDFSNRGVYTDVRFSIALDNITPLVLQLIGKQFEDLPFVLRDITLTAQAGSTINGLITIEALGS
jgi:hypothetical protein